MTVVMDTMATDLAVL